MTVRLHMKEWTLAEINAACRDAYRDYERHTIERYVAYFAGASPGTADEGHPYKASSLPAALPPG